MHGRPAPRGTRPAPWAVGRGSDCSVADELYRDVVLDYRYYVSTKLCDSAANATGLSPSTLSKFNGGKRSPRLDTYLALRAVLPEKAKELRSRCSPGTPTGDGGRQMGEEGDPGADRPGGPAQGRGAAAWAPPGRPGRWAAILHLD